MEIFIGWIFFSILVGVLWSSKKKGFAAGFFLSLLLSPLVGFIVGLIIKPDVKKQEEEAIGQGTMKKCPFCAELIKWEAKVCRYCGRDLPEVKVIPDSDPDPEPVKIDERGKFKCPHCNLTLWHNKYKDKEIVTREDGNYMVNCYYCHKKVIIRKQGLDIEEPKKDVYCIYCGTKVSALETTCSKCHKGIIRVVGKSDYQCSSCKKDIPENSNYCWNCGERFD